MARKKHSVFLDRRLAHKVPQAVDQREAISRLSSISQPVEDLTEVGWVSGPFGLKGQVKLSLGDEGRELLCLGLPVWFRTPREYFRCVVSDFRLHGSYVVASLHQVEDRTSIERLHLARVLLAKSDVTAINPSFVFDEELRGYSIFNQQGDRLGVVQDIVRQAGQRLLVIDCESQDELLVPWVDRYVLKIDHLSRQILHLMQ